MKDDDADDKNSIFHRNKEFLANHASHEYFSRTIVDTESSKEQPIYTLYKFIICRFWWDRGI